MWDEGFGSVAVMKGNHSLHAEYFRLSYGIISFPLSSSEVNG